MTARRLLSASYRCGPVSFHIEGREAMPDEAAPIVKAIMEEMMRLAEVLDADKGYTDQSS